MKKVICYVIIMLINFISACSPDSGYMGDYYIINNSNQKINIPISIISQGEEHHSLSLNPGDSYKESRSHRGNIGKPPLFSADSLIISYNDTTHITHFRTIEQYASRSILLTNSWAGGAIDDYIYKYEYVFNDADYEEALRR